MSNSEKLKESGVERNSRLKSVFEKVLEEWAFLWCDEVKQNFNEIKKYPIVKKVELKGPVSALLMVGSDFEFDSLLKEALTGSEDVECGVGDAFQELVNLLAGHIITDYFSNFTDLNTGWDAYLPQDPDPDFNPPRPPDAFLSAVVNGREVEIQLWENF
jgi:hypothetical protein